MSAQSQESPEYKRFKDALRAVLRVSHAELKKVLDSEKKAKNRRRQSKRVSSSPAAAEKS